MLGYRSQLTRCQRASFELHRVDVTRQTRGNISVALMVFGKRLGFTKRIEGLQRFGAFDVAAGSGDELVNAAVVGVAAMNSGAVKVSKPIDDPAVVKKTPVWRALEGVNDTLSPLTAANGS